MAFDPIPTIPVSWVGSESLLPVLGGTIPDDEAPTEPDEELSQKTASDTSRSILKSLMVGESLKDIQYLPQDKEATRKAVESAMASLKAESEQAMQGVQREGVELPKPKEKLLSK